MVELLQNDLRVNVVQPVGRRARLFTTKQLSDAIFGLEDGRAGTNFRKFK